MTVEIHPHNCSTVAKNIIITNVKKDFNIIVSGIEMFFGRKSKLGTKTCFIQGAILLNHMAEPLIYYMTFLNSRHSWIYQQNIAGLNGFLYILLAETPVVLNWNTCAKYYLNNQTSLFCIARLVAFSNPTGIGKFGEILTFWGRRENWFP